MKSLQILNKLLSDFDDLDSWSYEFIKGQLKKGCYLNLDIKVVQNLIANNLAGKRIPLNLDIIQSFFLKVNTPIYSALDHNNKIRKQCHKIIVFQDEPIEFDLILPVENKKMGMRQIKLQEISESFEVPNQLYVDRFFAEAIMKSNKILLYIKVREFSDTRLKYEMKEHIFDSRTVFNNLIDKQDWNRKLQLMIFEGQEKTEIIFNRSALWGYNKEYWDTHMKGQNIIKFYENKMQLESLGIKNFLLLEEFMYNFDKPEISNESIMSLSEKSVKYEQRVFQLVKNIEENNYVEN